jgi:cobalamin synthase
MPGASLIDNQKRSLEVAAIDSANLTAIFALFLKETFLRFLEETGRFFMFPIAAAGSCVQAVLAWRQAYLDKGKTGSVVKASVETAAALAIGTAVVGGFVAASLFAVAAPIIFTATLAAKSVYHAGAAAYYWGKSAGTSDHSKREAYKAMAKSNLVGAVAGSLSTVAVGLVMIAAKPLFAILGVVAGVIGTGYAAYKRWNLSSKKASAPSESNMKSPLIDEPEAPVDDLSPTSQARAHKSLRERSTNNQAHASVGNQPEVKGVKQPLLSPKPNPARVEPIVVSQAGHFGGAKVVPTNPPTRVTLLSSDRRLTRSQSASNLGR